MSKTIIDADAKYLLRGDTEENWEIDKPLLYKREIGLILDENDQTIGFKVGDGKTSWNNLPVHLIRDTEQAFDAKSENPMSGKAVAEAIEDKANLYLTSYIVKYVHGDKTELNGEWYMQGNIYPIDNHIAELRLLYPDKSRLFATIQIEIDDDSLYSFDNRKVKIEHSDKLETGESMALNIYCDVVDKQDRLSAGKGITIKGNVISASGGGSANTVINNLSASLGDVVDVSGEWSISHATRWSGNYADGFVHTGTKDSDVKSSISYPIPNSGTNYYLVSFKAEVPTDDTKNYPSGNKPLNMNEVTVSIGGSDTYDLYHGDENSASRIYYCGIQSGVKNTNLVISVVPHVDKIPFNVKISEITVQQIKNPDEQPEAEHVIEDENGQTLDEYRYNPFSLENIWHGYNVGLMNVEGYGNIGFGPRALEHNTTGFWNIGLGRYALHSNTVGSRNIGIGQQALKLIKSGLRNIGIGSFAMSQMTSGNFNNGVGVDFMISATGGEHNNGMGYAVLAHNTTGIYNVGLGSHVLSNNTTGNYNVGAGGYALHGNTTGTGNFGLGWQAVQRNNKGNQNVGIGHGALAGTAPVKSADGTYEEITYSNNVGIGYEAGNKVYKFGHGNTLIGYTAGRELTTGQYNIFIGYACGRAWKIDDVTGKVVYDTEGKLTGSKNIMIGYDLKLPENSSMGYLNIGNLIVGNDEVKFSNGSLRYAKYLQFKAPVRELILDMDYLPTSNPNIAGVVYVDENGFLKISTGVAA